MNDPDSPPLPRERPAPAFVRVGCVVAAGSAILVCLYLGSYLALSEPIPVSQGGTDMPTIFVGREQSFRFGGEAAELIFWPLTEFDAMVRPDYWLTPEARRLLEADRAYEASLSN